MAAAGAAARAARANSSAALMFPAARFDLVRTAIATLAATARRPAGAAPVQAMRLVSEVAQVRAIEEGAGGLRRGVARPARAGWRCCRSATPTGCRGARAGALKS